MSYETILYETGDRLATITLNRPEKFNTIRPPMPDELEQAIAEALANQVPHPNAVRQVLERRREQRDRPPPLPLTLADNDKARQVIVRPASLADYDQLDPEHDPEPTDDHHTDD